MSLYTSNNYIKVYFTYYKASFIKVIGIYWQDLKGTLYILYILKLATNLHKIFILCSLLII